MNDETTSHEKQTTIIVNAEEKEVATKELTFDQVVSLAFPNAAKNSNQLYTVTYRRAAGGWRAAQLVARVVFSGNCVASAERVGGETPSASC